MSPRCLASWGGGAAGLARSMRTRRMTLVTAASTYGGAGPRRGSPGVGSSRRNGWVGIAGGWRGAVVVELLATAGDALGSGVGPVLCVRAVGMRAGLLQPSLAPNAG